MSRRSARRVRSARLLALLVLPVALAVGAGPIAAPATALAAEPAHESDAVATEETPLRGNDSEPGAAEGEGMGEGEGIGAGEGAGAGTSGGLAEESPAEILLVPEPLFGAPAAFGAPADSGGPAAQAEEVAPLPGQSDQPAPPSRAKRVIENVHTDAVSLFVDDGRLALDSKADVDGELGKRFAAEATLFHLSDAGSTVVPANPAFGFLGAPGDRLWLAPQTQDHAVIWPGFSTEHPGLRAAAEGEWFKVRMIAAEGPGEVEVYLLDDGIRRLFSSTVQPPDWEIGVPQHTHMNWAFTEPGTYTLTFEVEGRIGGVTQTAQRDYTFVVGDLAAHARATSTTVSADAAAVEPGDPVTFTARVTPAAVGAVQFRDTASGAILGHAPVGGDGAALLRIGALPPGEHPVVAEFVPTWSDDFIPSASEALVVTVGGERIPRPEADDAEPVGEERLAAVPAGEGVRVTSPAKTVRAGAVLTARIDEARLHGSGDWVSVWVHGEPVWLGWAQLDLAGSFTVTIPQRTAPGEHRLVVKDREGALVGWDRFTVQQAQDPGGGSTSPPPEPPPVPAPAAPPQECLPAVTLEHGHIDAFTVSAGGGMAVLQLLEDVTGSRVLREAETVLLRVKESASASIPGLPGGPSGYVLPLTQNPNLIWPGWDTNRTSASGYSDVAITVTDVVGPGQVYLYTSQGAFGGWRPILTHGGYTLPGTIHEPQPAHTHAQWVFTRPGVYVLTAHAVATNPSTGESLGTASHSYVFQVGDVPLGDVFCGLTAHGAGAAAMVGAAVQQAGLDAVAAEQAEAAEQDRGPHAHRDTGNARASEDDTLLESLFGSGLHPAAVAGIVGGGLLAIAGIAGGTVWFLRRTGADSDG